MSTMTTQESLLALAKAVYGEFAHYNNSDLREDCRGLFIHRHGRTVKFDPANNSEQAMEVLCWLNKTAGSDIDFASDCVGIWNDADCRYDKIEHHNTPASLRAAIVQAACRVVQS